MSEKSVVKIHVMLFKQRKLLFKQHYQTGFSNFKAKFLKSYSFILKLVD